MKSSAVKVIGAVALVLAMAVNFAQAAPKGAPNPGVAPPQSSPYGQTYGEWAAAWWQWAASVPSGQNPLLDETGANVSSGQSGPVWFLCGVFNETGSATRTATIPAGKALFFPVLNTLWIATPPDNATTWEQPYTDPSTGITWPSMEAYARAQAEASMDSATDLACEVDGVAVKNVASYREESPEFDLILPADNIFGLDPGEIGPGVDSGYYLFLAPLPAGQHTIHFHGSLPGFTLDIVYNLTVLK